MEKVSAMKKVALFMMIVGLAVALGGVPRSCRYARRRRDGRRRRRNRAAGAAGTAGDKLASSEDCDCSAG